MSTPRIPPQPFSDSRLHLSEFCSAVLMSRATAYILVWAPRSEGDTEMRPKIGAAIVEQFGDGKWHLQALIAKALDTTEDHVATTLETMRKMQTYGAQSERKQVGESYAFRIFRKENMISSNGLVDKLGPIIKGLKAEGKKNAATMSPGTVAHLAARLQRLLDEWIA